MPKKAKESTNVNKETKKNKSAVSSKKNNNKPKKKQNSTTNKTKTQTKKSTKTTSIKNTTNSIKKDKVKETKVEKQPVITKTKEKEIKKEKKKISLKEFFNNLKPKFSKKDKTDSKQKKKVKKEKPKAKKEKKKLNIKSLFSNLKSKFSKKDKKTKKVEKKKFNIKAFFANIKNNITFSKKTKKIFIIVAIICALILVLEGGYVIYHKIKTDLNTIYYDSLNSLTIDGSDILAVGSSNFRYSNNYNYTNGLEKAKLIKYDKKGNILFEKQYEKGINTTFSSAITVEDGYVVVGSGVFSEEEQTNGGREAIIIKYDKEGNIVWEDFYQVVTNTRFNKVIATADGYVAVGQSIYANMEMGNHKTGGGIIVKYDFDGNIVWYNNHGGLKSGNFNDIVEVEGDFYVVGKDGTDCGNIVKFDKDGKYVWHKNYRYTDTLGFSGIAYLDEHLYVVGSKKVLPEGTTDDDDRKTTNTDALLVKYNLKGKVVLEKTFGGSNYERYNSIVNYYDELYIVGHITSKDAGLKIETDGTLMTGIIVEYDKEGNISRKQALGGSNDDNLTDITTDGVSLYISGYSNSEDGNIITSHDNGKDYFGKVIKLDSKFRSLLLK